MSNAIYDLSVKTIDNKEINLDKYSGEVLLIVNVASQCGLTPQYEALESLYEKYQPKGFEILAFPANEFGAQEPGTNEEIHEFCQTKFNVKFPMFSKIVVKGEGQHPLYKHLTETQPEATKNPDGTLRETLEKHGLLSGEPNDILWNFEKFLINRDGEVVARFAPDVTPDSPIITEAIEKQL